MPPREYICPSCSALIPTDDVDAAYKIVLWNIVRNIKVPCRKCGKQHWANLLSTIPNVADVLSKPPPKGVKMERDMMGGGVTLTCRESVPFPAILFTALCFGGIIAVYGWQIYKGVFDIGSSLLGILFLIGTIAFVPAILFILVWKRTIHLNMGQGSVFEGIGRLGWKRKFTYNRNSSFILRTSSVNKHGQPYKVITINTDNKLFSFGGLIKDEAKEFILATLIRESHR